MTALVHLDPGSNEELQFLEELSFDLGPPAVELWSAANGGSISHGKNGDVMGFYGILGDFMGFYGILWDFRYFMGF